LTEVHDGDTLTLVNWNATFKMPLTDIDAPEWGVRACRVSQVALFHLYDLQKATAKT